MGQVHGVHPECERARNAQEDYSPSESAALVAVSLISSARVLHKLDSEYTQYSAQYLVDNARVRKEGGREGEMEELTVKDGLKYALREGLPKHEHWGHMGCVFEVPSFACLMPRVPMKGEVIEANSLDEGVKLLMQQPTGARLHVFSPEIDNVGEDGIYVGPTSEATSYVGLRDVVFTGVKKHGDTFVTEVQICYKKKTFFVKVSMKQMVVIPTPPNGDSSQVSEPTHLLVDFCIPRLSLE